MRADLDAKWLELHKAGKAEWMPGMSTDGMTVVDADETGISIVRKETIQDHSAPKDAVPDWTDPATLGALLGQVREAWGMPVAVWHPKDGGVCIGVGRLPVVEGRYWTRATKAAALLAALEAAP
tara:strand:+ start:213 stop:584 length:372 start_codon:yes stop_codon:yes gene_type:complete